MVSVFFQSSIMSCNNGQEGTTIKQEDTLIPGRFNEFKKRISDSSNYFYYELLFNRYSSDGNRLLAHADTVFSRKSFLKYIKISNFKKMELMRYYISNMQKNPKYIYDDFTLDEYVSDGKDSIPWTPEHPIGEYFTAAYDRNNKNTVVDYAISVWYKGNLEDNPIRIWTHIETPYRDMESIDSIKFECEHYSDQTLLDRGWPIQEIAERNTIAQMADSLIPLLHKMW